MQTELKIKKLEHAADLPTPKYETDGSAGMDMYAAIKEDVLIKKNEYKLIPTGIQIALPNLHEAQIRPRSGLAAKNGLTVLNTPGTIDSDYRGEISVILINHGNVDFVIKRGMRIAQMIINEICQLKVKEEDTLTKTKRGSRGFGSTGVK
tara:strand:+ start:132 stop:581 length:450 start_codon:yes stop_codon:yes gene_type:complete